MLLYTNSVVEYPDTSGDEGGVPADPDCVLSGGGETVHLGRDDTWPHGHHRGPRQFTVQVLQGREGLHLMQVGNN